MRNYILRGVGSVIFLAMLLGVGGIRDSALGARIELNIGLPSVVLHADPPVVVIPGTYVYMVPDIEASILFYDGYWYRPYEGRWFRAESYNGPWVYVEPSWVPRALIELPPDYRHLPRGYHRIPYAEFRGNWQRWEHERHWDRDRDWRAGWHGRPEGRGHEEWNRGHEERGRGHEEWNRGHEEHGRH